MKMLVLYLPNASVDVLFSDEGLENFNHLMGIGCYGFLSEQDLKVPGWMVLAQKDAAGAGDGKEFLTLWEYLTLAGKRCLVIGEPPKEFKDRLQNLQEVQTAIVEMHAQGGDDFFVLKQLISSQGWDYCQFLDASGKYAAQTKDAYLQFDQELGETLGLLDNETIIAVIASLVDGEKPGCFVLAAPNNPLVGKQEGGDFFDVSPTLLELAGFPLPENLLGKSWVSGMTLADNSASGITDEEEEILRERLSGLGYI